MRLFKKDNMVINMFLTLLGFDYLSMGNQGEIWKHHSKNIIERPIDDQAGRKWCKYNS